MKKQTIYKYILLTLTLAINVFIIVNSCLNGSTSGDESNGVAHFFANIINFVGPNTINDSNFGDFAYVIRKLIGHFSLFLVNGLLSFVTAHEFMKNWRFAKFYWTIAVTLFFGLFIASLSEVIQLFTPGRFGSMVDVGIDFGGFTLGAGISFLILVLNKQIKLEK